MLIHVHSGTVFGVGGALVEIEVLISDGPASFSIMGLSDVGLNRLQERISEAITNSGYLFPDGQITVKLTPAGFPDRGAYELAVATGILFVSGQINRSEELDGAIFLGELSDDGSVSYTNGILPMLEMAREKHFRSVFIPAVNVMEATLVEGMTIYPVERLEQLVAHLNNERHIEPYRRAPLLFRNVNQDAFQHDMAEVRGQEHVKRALEVAASGGHHILLSGAPGSGKRMLACTLPSILPQLTTEEILEIARIYSVNGMLSHDRPVILQRPFRVPHSHVSYAELIGGGRPPSPGEVSLAHQGVLFLDDLSSFGSNMLEALCRSLEERRVTLQWDQQIISYPACTLLIATVKPCPCGFLNDPTRECSCLATDIEFYQKRISGPLPGCFDIFVEVPRIDYEKLASKRQAETSAVIRNRVQAARERQRERLKRTAFSCNAEISFDEVAVFCQIDPSAEKLLSAATEQLHLPLRSYDRIMRLARTIADLAGSEMILANHVAEAIQYRPRMNFK
jgi:magnesium chelatase family protein